jgi:putative endonuclease
MAERKRQKAELRGHWAEWRACMALRLKGYRLLARRFRTPLGEVDLIMRRGRVTAFIEVKARRGHDAALEAVTPFAQRRIAMAADLWLRRDSKSAGCDIRFDIVAVAPYRWPLHFENAFSPRE